MLLLLLFFSIVVRSEDVWNDVHCHEVYQPGNCNLERIKRVTVDDFDRCAPALLPLDFRNYFLGAAGRRDTYKENKAAYRRIKVIPKALRNVLRNSLRTTVLGHEVDFPIGLSPVAFQKLAHPAGELATLSGLSGMKTVMILSSYSTTSIEDVGSKESGTNLLWMQTYIFKNRSLTEEIVKKADRSGFKAIVLTADSSIDGTLTCNARTFPFPPNVRLVNLGVEYQDIVSAAASFDDIRWLKTITKLPIVVKGILSGEDAKRAITAGASAILVSNHGGRQLDSDPATIDVVSSIVEAVSHFYPPREVYLDGGIRSGQDAFKALAMGARMVFFGRPIIWGLTINGSAGVKQVLNTLKNELNETMLLSGCPRLDGPRLGSMTCIHSHIRECSGLCLPGYVFEVNGKREMTLWCSSEDGRWRPHSFFSSCRSMSKCELELLGQSSYNCTINKDWISCRIACNGRNRGEYECRHGQWQPALPQCVTENEGCGEPKIMGGSSYNCTTGMQGTDCDIVCDGFQEGRHHCHPDRMEWTPPLPSCVRAKNPSGVKCEEPEVPNHGRALFHHNDSIQSPGSVLRYACNEGFEMVGADSIYCLITGQWSTPPPLCVPPLTAHHEPECEDPGPISNGRFQPSSPGRLHGEGEEHYREGTRLEYSCHPPYVLRGIQTITCSSTERWSSDPPSCVEDCGRSSHTKHRIHNGNRSEEGEWPWMVAISKDNSFVCGGILINRRTVLTAAHCINEGDHYVLRFGKFNLSNSLDDDQVVISRSTQLIVHPHYNASTHEFDIAMIKFFPVVRYNNRIQPICLPTTTTTRLNIQPGRYGYVTGWGQMETHMQPSELLMAYLPVQPDEKCVKNYKERMRPGMFCAGLDYSINNSGKTASPCTGDSGSGLVFVEQSGRHTVEGIVSFSFLEWCGSPGKYTVFTRVSDYMHWIRRCLK